MEHREEKFKNLLLLGSILAVLGIGLSIYSLMHHLELKQAGATNFACNINDTLSCDDIANSKYAEDPWANPMGVYGIGYFLGLFALLMTARVKANLRQDALQAYAVMVGIGVVTSIVLFGISEFIIGKICPTCIGIYAVTLMQGAVLFFSRDAIPKPWNIKSISNGGWYGIIALVATIAVYQVVKPASTRNFKPDNPMTDAEVKKHMEKLGANREAPILASLDPTPSPAIKIDFTAYSGLGEDYRKGSDDAKVKIVEFADYQCPACATASKAMKALAADLGDKVLIVFKNFPLDSTCNPSVQTKMHAFACEAAIMTRCAGQIGKFWEMNEKVYDNYRDIDSTRLIAWAKDVGLNDDQIKQCKASPDIVKKIQDDVKQANEAGLSGTPTIFINGRKYNGAVEPETMKQVVQALQNI
ncbi:MAG TPA: thioredoxin domain-containing protein [Oligoflexus sp.]|uniref:thioredoxin domain-containing protein n=1 Tax=Oligoflexus sp. TaxID=1971216 RepID=UPI002D2D7B5A|nr:thioredoxin domain-containing protein [Oligoflexus sp.]HYX34647.1 thioredoxin domain-containing protein [Oligoflexus sp.]